MKRLFFALILVAGAFAVTNVNAQPHYRGRVGFGFPHPHVFFAPPRPVVIYPPVPYYGGVSIAPPVYGYGYGYRHYAPHYYEHRYYRGRRW